MINFFISYYVLPLHFLPFLYSFFFFFFFLPSFFFFFIVLFFILPSLFSFFLFHFLSLFPSYDSTLLRGLPELRTIDVGRLEEFRPPDPFIRRLRSVRWSDTAIRWSNTTICLGESVSIHTPPRVPQYLHLREVRTCVCAMVITTILCCYCQ